MNTLGFVALRPDNGSMEIKSDNPDHGFQFPGQFELSAMGPARISCKHSSNGKYVSVRIVFKAESREQYDLAHQALRDHPEVKWTL